MTECEGRQELGIYSMNALVILKTDNFISESFYLVILMPLLTCRTLKQQEQHGSELVITTQPDGQKW